MDKDENDENLDDAAMLEAAHKLLLEPEGIEPQSGDTVMEYRDGEAWIYAVPEPGADSSSEKW